MVFPVIGGDGKPTGYEIDNSLRFNDGDSPSLQFTPSSAGNEKTWTVSFWVKRGVMGTSSSQMIFASDTNYNEYVFCRFCGTEVTGKTDMFQVFMVEPNAREGNVRTTRLFRDPSAWYHIVVRCDLTQGTAADRLRIYVNGVKETSFDTASYLNQNDDNINWNSNVPQAIGHQKQASSVERHLDGYISEFYNIDGSSLGPDSFGETNDNGVWIPKDAKNDLTFGTNGYYLQFKQTGTSANASGIGADTSGNDHHWTPNNLAATDVTTDTPTNNFCTLNPLASESGFTFSEGNTTSVSSTDNTTHGSTFAVRKGKWYWEVVFATHVDSVGSGIILVEDYTSNLGYSGATSYYFNANGDKIHNSTATSLFGNISNEGHLQYALDLDNGRFSFGFEGTWSNGSSAQSTTFNASDFDFTGIPTGVDYFIARGQMSGTSSTLRFNFGNPALSPMGNGFADGNGYGNFKTAVPSGYYALCTKNLAEYG